MKEFIENISKVEWWLSIFFIGIVINIIAAFIKPLIDKLFSKYSERYKKRVELKKKETEEQINEMIIDRTLYLEKHLRIIHVTLWMGFSIILSAIMLSLAYFAGADSLFFIILAVLFLIMTIISQVIITNQQGLIGKYKDKLKETKKDQNKEGFEKDKKI